MSTLLDTPVLWWIKRDFRLQDCPALRRALDTQRRVIALWIFEPSQQAAPEYSSFHGQAQLQAAQALRKSLRARGGELCIVQGEVLDVLNRVRQHDPFRHLVSHQEVGGLATFARDRAVKAWAQREGVTWIEYRQTGVFRALDSRNHRARYWHAWMKEPLAKGPSPLEIQRIAPSPALARWLDDQKTNLSTLLARHLSTNTQRVGELYAQRTLDSFLASRAQRYAGSISSPVWGAIFGSRLSSHLAWGSISPRTVMRALERRLYDLSPDAPGASRWQRSLGMFRSRIHWRDHFMQRIECAPDLENTPLCTNFEEMLVKPQPAHLQAWRSGETGFPLVDACIKSAQHQGFLNFRMRAMITSLGCHILRIPWRELGWTMAQWWADYEPGIHWAQIQMQSGMTGINSNRIYDPQGQLRRLDPEARFIKRWLPALAEYSPAAIMQHHKVPLPNYPPPRVHWTKARQSWREDYAQIQQARSTRSQQQAVLARHGSRR